MNRKSLKQNLIFTVAVLLAAAVLFGLRWYNARQTAGLPVYGLLTYGEDNRTMEIPLEENRVYDIDTGLYTIHLEVKDGAVGFVNSPCPDHVCEGYGYLSAVDSQAVCMPARAWLVIVPVE